MKSEDELRRERRLGLLVAGILMALAVAFYVTVKFITPRFRIPTASMQPTIHPGDHVFVNRLAYAFGERPKSGEVVHYRGLKGHKMLHRILAGPGDTLEMRDNVVFVNGNRLSEPYTMLTPDVPAVRTFGPLTIKPGHYFLLGDNRDNANDSRFQGEIAAGDIKGRMFYVLHIGQCEE